MARTLKAPFAFAAILLAMAPAAPSPSAAKGDRVTETILIRGGSKAGRVHIRFDGPKTIRRGDFLRIRVMTNGRRVGGHSFSLVRGSLRPRTREARRVCYSPGRICQEIGGWHGTDGQGPVTRNPVRTGRRGWDTAGNYGRRGDSWYTGLRRGSSLRQVVSAPPGTVLHFMCAIHPAAQGQIRVIRG